jgi:hypothetical protein
MLCDLCFGFAYFGISRYIPLPWLATFLSSLWIQWERGVLEFLLGQRKMERPDCAECMVMVSFYFIALWLAAFDLPS